MTAILIDFFQNFLNLGQLESEIVTSIIIFVVSITIGWIIYTIFKRYIISWAKETKTKIDDEILRNIKAPIILLAFIIGLHFALQPISFIDSYAEPISQLFNVAQILVATFIIARVFNILLSWFGDRAKSEKRMSEHLLSILKQLIRAVVYLFAFFAILSVFNIDLSGVVVGFGVGGIAIALALQNILGDAFSAFLIYFDRPFEIGDFIVIGEYSGNVKKIGIRSTRIKLLQGEELVVSNRELTTTDIRNFKKLRKRRVVFKFGVAVDTSSEKLKKIPKIIKEIINEIKLAEFGRAHFSEFGDFTLNFEVVYYIKSPDYDKFMDIKQAINLRLVEAFEREHIVMPYPTQTVLLEKD
jgi:small-conductance mechanosensitive channel